ncbi:MAG: RNA methyltransferase [Firmicutes bacterium]|nr:RNA methyltransferase [Bacillota bacterium]
MEKFITSTDNPIFKSLKKITTTKGRHESGLCIIEGEKIIFENLDHVEQIFIIEGKEITPNLRDMEPIVLSKKLFKEISDLDTPCGIFATATIPQNGEVTYPLLILDQIQDPGNMGTLVRTAVAFGFKSIVAIFCPGVFSQKVIRAAMGQQFKLDHISCISVPFFAENYKQYVSPDDVTMILADLNGESIENFSTDFEQKFALVLGNEGQGIGEHIKKIPHTVITIPMSNNVESLNVAVAGGILMHELRKV